MDTVPISLRLNLMLILLALSIFVIRKILIKGLDFKKLGLWAIFLLFISIMIIFPSTVKAVGDVLGIKTLIITALLIVLIFITLLVFNLYVMVLDMKKVLFDALENIAIKDKK